MESGTTTADMRLQSAKKGRNAYNIRWTPLSHISCYLESSFTSHIRYKKR
ncbi:hypothetical protein SLEP1_g59180 [Rubroshorea leprosula]|uniref:Uncharacterized protein n=1 Tax=Rubroshorea leprosula TaxID=152421 RepID=A0AAV5MU22_9ROSI|nr:hypothetical protein SLEP1_g59180 [Rubroshorea leprosula]